MRISFLILSALLVVTACNEAPKTEATVPANDTADVSLSGCYLGNTGNSQDSLQLRLHSGSPDEILGDLRIALKEKDQRVGAIRGLRGNDGIYRATFWFMQEGMTDSIRMHFRVVRGATPVIELRPSGFDPATAREYPDSSKPFSIQLLMHDCKDTSLRLTRLTG